MKKKILGLMFTLCALICLFSATNITAGAQESGTCGANITWVLDDNGTLTISGTGYMSHFFDSPWSASNVKSVIIENGVTSIGRSAFDNCSSLTDVYYNGNKEQWQSISIGSSNSSLTRATIHFLPNTATTQNGNTFTVTPRNLPDNCLIMLVCYNNDICTYVGTYNYDGSSSVPFSVDAEYDKVKVFVWNDMSNPRPVTSAENVL
ncbi:MAG: leucine-rich repeat protein [Clostridiales bacterium]|nr:leucine-rich repeat protein [Clostridiales bacterium]